MTVLAQREIAVHTEKAIPFFGEASFLQRSVKSCSRLLGSVLSPSTVDVVDSHKFKMAIPTTLTTPTVGGYNSFFQFSVVLLEVLFALNVSFLLLQNFLSILSVVGALTILLNLSILGVVLFAPEFFLLSIRCVKLSVLFVPVIGMRFLEFLHGSLTGWGIFDHLLNHSTRLLKECQHA